MIFKKKEKELSIKDFKNPAKTYADMASQVNFYKVVILSLIIINLLLFQHYCLHLLRLKRT